MENPTTIKEKSGDSPRPHLPAAAALTVIAHQLRVRNLLIYTHRHFDLLSSSLHLIYTKSQKLIDEATELAKMVKMDNASLERLTHSSLQSINHILINLQYQDMIRQKLEHNQQINEIVLAWMQETVIDSSSTPLEVRLALLPNIVQLQSAHLDYTDNEYQKALQNMRASLDEFGENIQHLSAITSTIVDHLADKICETLKKRAGAANTLIQQVTLEASNLLSKTSEAHLFTETVKKIKFQWQKLVSELPIPVLPYSSSDLELLAQLESLYTMESERYIFLKTFFPQRISGSMATNEGDVELF